MYDFACRCTLVMITFNHETYGTKRKERYMMETWLQHKLRLLRVRQGLTLVEAAEKTGVTRATLSELERGNRHPVAPTLAKIAAGYGVPVEELLEEPIATPLGEAPPPPGPSLAKWLEEQCGHAYLALPKDEFEEMFDRMPEGASERRELALEVNREYNTFCDFPANVTPAERIAMRKMIRDAIPEVAVKHGIALMEGGLDRGYQEEAARIFEVERATESATA